MPTCIFAAESLSQSLEKNPSFQVQFLHSDAWHEHEATCSRETPDIRATAPEPEVEATCPSLAPYRKDERFLEFVCVYLDAENAKKRMACSLCDAKYETLTQLKRHIQVRTPGRM